MASKKQLTELIKTLKKKTGKTQAELSEGAGYAPKTLTQLLSKGENLSVVYDQLMRVYGQRLNGSTHNTDLEANLMAIARSLANLENGQHYIRAEVRGYGQYQIQQEVGWDQKKFLEAMAKVGMIVGANLQAGDLQGSAGTSGSWHKHDGA
jgi:transcriptional regulator with XRE-family HTH domain